MLPRFFLVIVLACAVSGCATTQDQTLITQLQLRVGGLERDLGLKENQIMDMQSRINELSYEVDRLNAQLKKREPAGTEEKQVSLDKGKAKTGIIRIGASTEKVQMALQNAGYYKGPIDNKIGGKTKEAISQFQKDHGLKADGVVGQRTWEELKSYLE